MICPHCREYTSWRYKRCPECGGVLPDPVTPEEVPQQPPSGPVAPGMTAPQRPIGAWGYGWGTW